MAALVGRCGVEVAASSLGCGRAAAPAASPGGAFCSAEFSACAGDLTCCGSVGCCAATDVRAVTGPEASGATEVRAATDFSATGRSSNENTVAAPAGAPMIAAHHDQARRANEATHRCYIAPFWIEVAGVTQHEVLPRQLGRCPKPCHTRSRST